MSRYCLRLLIKVSFSPLLVFLSIIIIFFSISGCGRNPKPKRNFQIIYLNFVFFLYYKPGERGFERVRIDESPE
jgi:hypothetical protein